MRDVNTQIRVIYLFDFALSSTHAAWGLLPVLKVFAFSSVKIPIVALSAATAGSWGSSAAQYYLKNLCWKPKSGGKERKPSMWPAFGMSSRHLAFDTHVSGTQGGGNVGMDDNPIDGVVSYSSALKLCAGVWRQGVKKQNRNKNTDRISTLGEKESPVTTPTWELSRSTAAGECTAIISHWMWIHRRREQWDLFPSETGAGICTYINKDMMKPPTCLRIFMTECRSLRRTGGHVTPNKISFGFSLQKCTIPLREFLKVLCLSLIGKQSGSLSDHIPSRTLL